MPAEQIARHDGLAMALQPVREVCKLTALYK